MSHDPGATRRPLSRERILRTAVEMADESGLEGLSMRKLAGRLGVEAMSLYHHVAGKEDLLDGMADLVVAEVELPSLEIFWKAALRRRSASAYEMLSRHPWATLLMESRATPGPASLRYYDAMIGCFREAGFTVEAAAHGLAVLDAFVYGFRIQEMSMAFGEENPVEDVAGNLLEQFLADDYPYLYEMIVEHALLPGYDFSAEFGFALDLILDALERLRDA